MAKKIVLYVLFAVIGAFSFFALTRFTQPFVSKVAQQDKLYKNRLEPVLGVYDRHKKITSALVQPIAHYKIKWNNTHAATPHQTKRLSEVIKDKRDILLSIYMSSSKGEAYTNHGILQGMINGNYDNKIIKFCNDLSSHKGTVYLRLNPEMELPIKKYQYQYQSSYLYLDAFRHFSEVCKKHLPAAKIVWGPVGYAGVLEYWPGAEWVDYASVTLTNQPDELAAKYPAEYSIPVQVKRKLHRLRFIDKPVLFLGSEDVKKESFKAGWIDAAAEEIKRDTAVIYSSKNFVRPRNEPAKRTGSAKIGVFDPAKQLVWEKSVGVEHLFPNFEELKNGTFQKEFDAAIARKHDVIVTMEFWKDKNMEKDSLVLLHTINGRYDAELEKMYNIISNVKQTVYLRWAHEMEIPITRYPWQSQDPATYIKAFRYFMNFDKHRAKNILRVWGPTGDRGALDWWPGADVVDYISLAIYGLPNKDITDHNRQETFSTIFKRKYNRMRFVNKPIFITEFGVKGPQAYKRKWLEDAAATINNSPQIVGVSYFNFTDAPKAWGDIEPPDWSVSKETFSHFTSLLK